MPDDTQETESIQANAEKVTNPKNLFSQDVVNNRIWFHGTSPKNAESILKDGLRPTHHTKPKPDNMARILSLSLDPRFGGGESFVAFEVEENDVVIGGSAPSRMFESAWMDSKFDQLPSDRGVFYADSVPFQGTIREVGNKVNKAMEEESGLIDVSLRESLKDIETSIEKYGVFKNPDNKNPENIHRLAEAILWNEVDNRVGSIASGAVDLAKHIKEIKNKSNPDNVEALLRPLKEERGRASIESLKKFPAKLRSAFRLVEIGGEAFSHPDYNFEEHYNREEMEQTASWVESLILSEEKVLKQEQLKKDVQKVGKLRGLLGRFTKPRE